MNPRSSGMVTQVWPTTSSIGSCTKCFLCHRFCHPFHRCGRYYCSAHGFNADGTHTDDADDLIHDCCSYETCGNLDSYASEKHYRSLRGKHIRVSYPGDSSTGYTLLTEDDGSRGGSVVEFMRGVASDAGFTWEVHEVSPASRARYSSSYSACAHEVALNRTDVSTNLTDGEPVSTLATFAKFVCPACRCASATFGCTCV